MRWPGAPAPRAILLGHSLDDQAETVLLGLARGSGARSLRGMPAPRGHYRRPLLGVSRATLRAACDAAGLQPWDDPHNADPAFARARVRQQALPALEAALGPGVAQALARTAGQLRSDARGTRRARRQPGAADAGPGRRLAGRRAAGRARRDQDPRAADGGDRSRVPSGQAHRPARRRARRPGDRLARAALDHPARGSPRHAPVWQADLRASCPARPGRAAGADEAEVMVGRD